MMDEVHTPALRDIELMLMQDYRLTTAEIYYYFPDHPSLLQSYIWQSLDMTPDFPKLTSFLSFWERCLDGKLHSIEVTSCEYVNANDYIGRSRSIMLQ